MELNIVTISGFVSVLLTIIVGFMQLSKKIEDSGYWRGMIESEMKAHERMIATNARELADHSGKLDRHESWIQRHQGESRAANG